MRRNAEKILSTVKCAENEKFGHIFTQTNEALVKFLQNAVIGKGGGGVLNN